jgi:hypothetical protein
MKSKIQEQNKKWYPESIETWIALLIGLLIIGGLIYIAFKI